MITGWKVVKVFNMASNQKAGFGEIIVAEKKEKCYFCEKDILENSFCVYVKMGRKAQFSHLKCFEEYIIEYRGIIDEVSEAVDFLEEIKKEKYAGQLVIDSLRDGD